MHHDDVTRAYSAKAAALAQVLGTAVSSGDPDAAVIEAWAASVPGRILDVGSGTGRWSGHLAGLGHAMEGLEPVDEFVEIARRAHPDVTFRRARLTDLAETDERWSGILAWYSLIHLDRDDLPTALSILREALDVDGSLLVSFFTGPRFEVIQHPATTAYLWPADEMTRALDAAGFEVVEGQVHPEDLHAHISARARARSPLSTQ